MHAIKNRVVLAVIAGALCAGATAQEGKANPEGRPSAPPAVTLGADDVRAYPPPPAGFADAHPDAAQGTVVEFSYDSPVTGTKRKANVYLPPGYSAQRRYPVLYLLHGIAGNHHEWTGYVHAQAILDNLMSAGAAKPMIVVMPNGRAMADDRPPPPERMFTPEHVAAFGQFERELLETLIPAIDRAYPTLPERGQRALAGLSMGGGQALNIGIGHPDTFAWVGGFSAAPNTRAAAPGSAPLRLLYLSCGNKDGLIGVSQGMHRALQKQGVAHVWNVDVYGHDRESWAENLYQFSRLLFR